MSEFSIVDNAASKRYEVEVDGQIAFIDYIPAGQNIVLSHTEVPESLEGQGVGSRLAKQVLDTIKATDQKVIVTCPFLISYIRNHREYLDIVFGYPKKTSE